jgi:hypothetical protein
MNLKTNYQSARTKGKPNGNGMVLTDRDRRIIEAIAKFGIATREQISKHLKFGSVTRANAVLLRLFLHGYLDRRLQPSLRGTRRLTYVVGPHGDELLGPSTESAMGRRRWSLLSDLFVDHQLDVNDVRLAFEHLEHQRYEFVRFLSERELAAMKLEFVPDGYCEYRLEGKSYSLFLEIDRGTESMGRWTSKVKAYLRLAHGGDFSGKFGRRFFRVLVSAPSGRRLKNLTREIARHTDRIFWLAVHAELLGHGPFGFICYRPDGAGPKSLIE